ncbi:lipopolysaccharide biosynthesis protein [Microvirga lenta]|uniref:lipopolysaccharide biosynthesis protein n=1 Tax=Microvirga lenta TaxID=2881337 RepID=UPI001CFF7D91|nr:oligosaccharide flippase family protein [Microvirga lenta]MCB5175364.1 oligosaccharide flippase family protein [Microvirga lenta]
MIAPIPERRPLLGRPPRRRLRSSGVSPPGRAAVWIDRLRGHAFLRGVAVVVGGTAAAQLITLAFSPLITRLYGPEIFGVQGIFLAAVGLVLPFANLAYGASIVLPATDNEARALFRLSVLISLAVTALSTLVFGIFHRDIAEAIGFTAPSQLLWLAPVTILVIAVAQPFHHWLARKKQFGALSRISVAEATIVGGAKTAVGFVAATAPVLLTSVALAGLLKLALLWTSARDTLVPGKRADQDPPVPLRDVAYRYRDFPLFRAPHDWLNGLSHNIPSLMLAALVGPVAAGFYVLSYRVVSLPITVISAAVGTVFLPRIAEASHRSERLRPLLLKGTAALAAVGLLPFGIMIAFAPWLFSLVFGAEWTAAGDYARWLSLWFYIVFIGSPAYQAIPILGLQGHLLAYEIVVLALRTSALAVGAFVYQDGTVAVALFAVVGMLVNISQIGWCIFSCDRRLRSGI